MPGEPKMSSGIEQNQLTNVRNVQLTIITKTSRYAIQNSTTPPRSTYWLTSGREKRQSMVSPILLITWSECYLFALPVDQACWGAKPCGVQWGREKYQYNICRPKKWRRKLIRHNKKWRRTVLKCNNVRYVKIKVSATGQFEIMWQSYEHYKTRNEFWTESDCVYWDCRPLRKAPAHDKRQKDNNGRHYKQDDDCLLGCCAV
jgi:hypothetical protein